MRSLYKAVMISFFFGFLLLLCTKPFKEKEHRNKFQSSSRNEMQQSETTTNWVVE